MVRLLVTELSETGIVSYKSIYDKINNLLNN